MKRSSISMQRSAFSAQHKALKAPRLATQIGPEYTLRPRAVAVAVAGPARATVSMPKDDMIQHGAYMAFVRALACDVCGKFAPSLFCHADVLGKGGKGMGIKSDCRLGWPGCHACHYYVGTSGALTKETRRRYEAAAGRRTRCTIRRMGQWPDSLPAWAADEVMA